MNSAHTIAQFLKTKGVDFVFGVPGEENLELLDAFREHKIRFIPTRHEQGGAFMAATVGRLTGKPGVVISTLGPGATNLLTGVAYAQNAGMPLIVITAQKPIRSGGAGKFQLVDTVKMFEPVSKLSVQIEHGEAASFWIQQAWKVAVEERPGVAHLQLPEDIASEASEGIFHHTHSRRPQADTKSLNAALGLIKSAKSPIFMIGAGANRHRISAALTEFIESHKIYFFTSQMGKGVVDERSRFYLGTSVLSSGDPIKKAVEFSDLVIAVGHDTYEKPPANLCSGYRKVIHLNFSSSELDQTYYPTLDVVGDIADTLAILSDDLHGIEWEEEDLRGFKNWYDSDKSRSSSSDVRMIMRTVRESLSDERDVLTLDNGLYKLYVAKYYPTYTPNSLLLDNALATMGAGLPSAIAAKLVDREREVIAMVGDGGFMMNSQELETLKRLNLGVIVLILRDDAFGMIRWKQENNSYETFGTDLSNPDFVQLAHAYGHMGIRVESIEDLKGELYRASKNAKRGISTVIDLPIHYPANL